MATAGPNFTTTAANLATSGTVPWSTPAEAQGAPDAVYATCDLAATVVGQLLKCTNYFTSSDITSGSTILGIQVEIHNRKKVNTDVASLDQTIQLMKAGTLVGSNKATSASMVNSTTAAYTSYGNSADLWGTTWTQADLIDPNFGIQIQLKGPASGKHGGSSEIDGVRITVTYTPGAAVPPYFNLTQSCQNPVSQIYPRPSILLS